jgi:hypothetical protein
MSITRRVKIAVFLSVFTVAFAQIASTVAYACGVGGGGGFC